MTDTIKLPIFGPTKKNTAYVIGAGVVLVGGIAWYRSRGTAAAADVGTGEATSDIDPATGFAYGSAEDANALAGQSASWSGGSAGGGDGTLDGGAPTPAAYTTNGQWAQAVEQYLVDETEADPNTVGNALGKYITGQPMSTDQVNIVQQAIAFGGYPPVNGPTGYPPSYRTADEPPPPPATVGTPAAPGSLKAVIAPGTKTTVNLSWSVPTDPNRSGTRAYDNIHPNHIAETTGTAITLYKQPTDKRKVTYHIRSVNSRGQYGPPSNYVTIGK